jgi:hypothetical protein
MTEQITLDRPAVQQRRMTATQMREQVRTVLSTPAIYQATDWWPLRPDDDQWHLRQVVKPLVRKRPDWREQLVRVFDRWAGRSYTPGEYECFLFACECLDAMMGTQFYVRHFRQWNTMSGFYDYARAVCGLDYFDCAGYRATPDQIRPGDLIQQEVETPIGGKMHVHWSIASDKPNRSIAFTTHDLEEAIAVDPFVTGIGTKVWRLADPLEVAQ